MNIESTIRDNLIITAFLIVIVDRFFILAVLKIKAERILVRASKNPTIDHHVLDSFVNDFQTVVMGLGLFCFTVLVLMQAIRPGTFSDDLGRVVFALLVFVLSVSGTILNMCIERIDLKKVQEAVA